MAFFTYTARNRTGQQIGDSIESSSRDAAIISLRAQGLLVLKIDERKKTNKNRRTFSLNPFDYRSIREKDLEHEFHQIAVMLRSGISLLDALELTSDHARIGAQKTWDKLIERIQQGSSFSDALAEHSIFSQFTLQLIHVGEQTGHLYTVMDQAAEEMKSTRELKKQISKALQYPAFMLVLAVFVVIFMLTNLIPEIKKLLKLLGRPMPPMTQALIDVSDWFLANGAFLTISSITSIMIFILFYNWSPSRWWIDKFALKIPLLGNIFCLSGTVLFSRAMSLLLRSGVVISEALVTMEKLHVNTFMASRINYTYKRVLSGGGLAESLSVQSAYRPLLLQMLSVGENSGTIDEILEEMAVFHDEQLKQSIAQLTGMIAPIMTVIVGGIIGFVYAAFLVAMFSAAGGSPS